MKRVLTVLALATALALLQGGCAGTGSPWTKQLRVAVLGLTGDGSGEVPITGASVTVTRTTSGTTDASLRAATNSQTLATGSDGIAVFRVEPGYTYTVAVTASGYSTGQVTVDVGFFAGTAITRTITLAPSGT